MMDWAICAWAVSALCVTVFVICEAVLTTFGLDTALWQFKTPEEKVLQRVLIEQRAPKCPSQPSEGLNTQRSSPAGCPGSQACPEPVPAPLTRL